MKIVGVGCGPGMLTERAIEVISTCEVIFGSSRAIECARQYINEQIPVQEISDYSSLKNLPENAVVLSTGDPMLAGLGFLPGEVIPGISSMQYACALLKIPLTLTVAVNAHGKHHASAYHETAYEISRGKIVFLITDPHFSLPGLADVLKGKDPSITIICLEDLGYPGERIARGSAREPPTPRSGLYVVVAGIF